MHMRNHLAATLALFLLLVPATAGATDAFTYLFARTCMQHFHAPEKLRSELAAQPLLEGESAEFFLDGAKGTAWAVNEDGARYVVAFRDDHVCAVFAQRATVEEVTRNFVANVGEAPAPLEAVERPSTGPSGLHLRTVAYAWTRKQDKTELLFTLTTSSEENPTAQAMASMAVVAKSTWMSCRPAPLRGAA
jgi:hypothetical protein